MHNPLNGKLRLVPAQPMDKPRKIRIADVLEFAPTKTAPSTVAVLHGAGTSTTRAKPVTATTAGLNFMGYFLETEATSGDTRGINLRLYFSGAGGSGEALRAYGIVNGVEAAVGGTVNGAHISMRIATGGSISGAAHALRATYEIDASVTQGGTCSVLQLDSSFGAAAVPGASMAFISLDNVGASPTTNGVPLLLNISNPDTSTFFVNAGTGANSAGVATGGVAAKVLKCSVGAPRTGCRCSAAIAKERYVEGLREWLIGGIPEAEQIRDEHLAAYHQARGFIGAIQQTLEWLDQQEDGNGEVQQVRKEPPGKVQQVDA